MANAKFLLFAFLLSTFALRAQAETLEIPIEELPSESVTPALDSPVAVQNRTLSYGKHWSGEAGTGWILDEPFYGNQYFGFRGMYHWNETSGLGFRVLSFLTGTSDYANQFRNSTVAAPNFTYARGPESGWAISYENRFIYGKVSFSKDMILPLSFIGQFELGQIKYGARSLPFLTAGVGNNLFFTKNWGINLMVRLFARQAIDPLSQTIVNNPTPAPSEGSFSASNRFNTALDFGGIFLF